MKYIFTATFALLLTVSAISQTITTFPYSTSFEGAAGTLNENFPSGWSWEDLNTNTIGNSNWQIIKNSEVSNSARTDSTAVHMFSNSSQPNNDWLYTPPVAVQAGYEYTMRFWYSVSAIFPSTEKLEVNIGSEQAATSMGASPIWSNLNITNTQYQEAVVTYTAATTEEVVFGFHSISDEVEFILLVDDVSISTNAPASITERETPAIALFPNPSSDIISINTTQEISSFMVCDTEGNTISKASEVNLNTLSISSANWSSGVYFIHLHFTNGQELKKRVVVNP